MIKKHAEKIALILLALTPLLIYFNPRDFDSMGADEILFARKSIYELFFEMKWGNQSPFYFLFVKLSTLAFGEGFIASRIFNIIPQALCTILVFNLTKQITKEKITPWISTLLFATAPINIMLCQDGRMYPFLILFSLVNFICTIQYLENRKITALIVLTISSILSGYNHFIGFIPIGFAYLIIFLSFFTEPIRSGNFKKTFEASRFINFFLIGLTGLLALTPQIIRIFNFLNSSTSGKSIYSLPSNFYDCALTILKRNLTFIPSNYSQYNEFIILVILISLALFFILGLCKSKIIHIVPATFWTIIPFLILTTLALYTDVRYRHFVFILPIFYIFVANGLVNLGRICKLNNKFLLPLLAVVILCNLIQLSSAAEYKGHQWNQLLSALSKLKGKENTDYYIIPRFIYSSIELTNDVIKSNLNLGKLAKIESWNRNFLEKSIANKRDVVFIRRSGATTKDLGYWKNALRNNGYSKEVLVVENIFTEIYSLRGREKLFDYDVSCNSEAGCANVESIIKEHYNKMSENQDLYDLSKLKVARLMSNGIIAKPSIFINNSLNPNLSMWQTGLNRWQTIKVINEKLSGDEKRTFYFQPNVNEDLIVSWPKRKFSNALVINYGILRNSAFRDSFPILSSLYMDSSLISKFGILNNEKWNTICINTKKYKNNEHMLSLSFNTRKVHGRNLLINFEEASSCKKDMQIKLDKRGLGPHIDKLKIKSSSTNHENVLHNSFYNIKYKAQSIHGSEGPNELGMLKNRWVVGDIIWQSVGETTQLVNGKPFNGLWMHPHRNYKLIIESNNLISTDNLVATFGFTDIAIYNSIGAYQMSPVDISIFLNNKLHSSHKLEKKKGLTKIILNNGKKINSFSIQISTENEKWSHLIGNIFPIDKKHES